MGNPSELSQRELEILELVATGASNKEIAEDLVISTNTVKVHLKNIYAKLNVNTRTEAALFAVKNDIFSVQLIPTGNLQPSSPRSIGARPVSVGQLSRPNAWNLSLALVGIVLLASIGIFILLRTDETTRPPNPSERGSDRLQIRNDLPTARSGFAVVSYENRIYAIAGEDESGITGVVERYDPNNDQWIDLPSKPLPVKDIAAAVIGGLIYLPGGFIESGEPTDVLEVLDPRDGTWSTRASLPIPLGGYSLAAFEGRLYLFGGWNGEIYVNVVFSYDPATNTWENRTPMPTARGFAGVAASSEGLFIIGGFDGEDILSANEVYYPQLDNGSDDPWNILAPIPGPRHSLGLVGIADIIHAVGGESNSESLSSFKYFPNDNIWEAFEFPLEKKWFSFGMVQIETDLYAFGGNFDGNLTGKNISYQVLFSVLLPFVQ